VAGWTCAAAGLVGLVWLIAAAFVQRGAIYPAEITDDDILLGRVSPAFKEAVEREHEDEDDSEKEGWPARPARPAPEERIYDPDAPERKPLPPDAYRAGEP
jgi:hypothetical protein